MPLTEEERQTILARRREKIDELRRIMVVLGNVNDYGDEASYLSILETVKKKVEDLEAIREE